MPYTLTTYDGEKIELMEQSPDKIRELAADAGLVAIQDSKGQVHYLGKGRLASIDYTKPEGPVVRPEQRLAMGGQKDNRSEGPEAEANRAWVISKNVTPLSLTGYEIMPNNKSWAFL